MDQMGHNMAGMDHSSHNMAAMQGMDHAAAGGMPMECAMKMTLNWDVENVCVVFSGWKINDTSSMVISCLAVVVLAVLYEVLRGVSSQWDTIAQQKSAFLQQKINHNAQLDTYGMDRPCLDDTDEQDHEILNMEIPHLRNVADIHGRSVSNNSSPLTTKWTRIPRSVLYGAQVFYSFMLMLIFMTYNGYLMISVGIGAAIGYYITVSYMPLISSRSAACH